MVIPSEPEENKNIIGPDEIIEGEYEVIKEGGIGDSDAEAKSEAEPDFVEAVKEGVDSKTEGPASDNFTSYYDANSNVGENTISEEEIIRQQQKQRKIFEEEQKKAEAEAKEKAKLTEEEQRFLHDRIMGRETAIDGSGATIQLANGTVLLDTVIEIGDELREFIGYKASSEAKLDEETAMAIVLTAKEKGWDSVDVHGSDEEKELLAKIAQEHGLEVYNYQMPDMVAPTQDTSFDANNDTLDTAKENSIDKEVPVYNGVVNAPPKTNFAETQNSSSQFIKLEGSAEEADIPKLPSDKDSRYALYNDKKDQKKVSSPDNKPSLPPPPKI